VSLFKCVCGDVCDVFRLRILITSMIVLLPVFKFPFFHSPSLSAVSSPLSTLSLRYKPHTRVLLTIITFLSLLITIYRLPRAPPTPFKPGPRIINSGIWTIHFGIDNEGHDSQRGIMSVIEDMKLDIVGFLETDLYVSNPLCLNPQKANYLHLTASCVWTP
jgi:hypothetical protein